MRLSRESEYGLSALIFLARHPRQSILPIREIARATGLPQSFLAKIFRKLAQHGLVRSFRGVRPGYSLTRPPKQVKVRELLDAIEGPDLFQRCIFWSNRCDGSHPCPLHRGWNKIKPGLVGFLEHTTLDDLSKRSSRMGSLTPRGAPSRDTPNGRGERA